MIQQHCRVPYQRGALPWEVLINQAEIGANYVWKPAVHTGVGTRQVMYKPGEMTEEHIFAFIQKCGTTGTLAIVKALHISNHTVLRHTRSLIKQGRIDRTQADNWSFRYSVNKAHLATL